MITPAKLHHAVGHDRLMGPAVYGLPYAMLRRDWAASAASVLLSAMRSKDSLNEWQISGSDQTILNDHFWVEPARTNT